MHLYVNTYIWSRKTILPCLLNHTPNPRTLTQHMKTKHIIVGAATLFVVGGLFSLKLKDIAAPILLIDSPKILFGKGFISDKYH